MTRVAAAGLMVLAASVALFVALLVLALTGSKLAPSPIIVVIAGWPGMLAAATALVSLIRRHLTRRKKQRAWKAEPLIPEEATLNARRAPKPLPEFPFLALHLMLTGLLILMLCLVSYPHAREHGALRMRGVETIGTVTDKKVYQTRWTTYWIGYQFQKGIRTLRDIARLKHDRWETLKVGDPITVTYLARAPGISLPTARAAMRPWDVIDWMPLAALGALPISFIPIAIIIRRSRLRLSRLVRDGTAVIATVKAVRGMRVAFSYPTPGGTLESNFLHLGEVLPKPAPGDGFVLLFDPARPKERIPWFMARASLAIDHDQPAPPSAGIIDRELLEPPPAEAAIPARVRIRWQTFLFPIVLLAMVRGPLINSAMIMHFRGRVARVASDGREVPGIVFATWIYPNDDVHMIHVHYRYRIGSRTYDEAAYVPSELRWRFPLAARTPVVYSAAEPRVSLPLRLKEVRNPKLVSETSFDFAAGAGFSLALLCGSVIFMAYRMVKEWRFARHGRVSVAQIEEAKGIYFLRCRYRFLAGHGDADGRALLVNVAPGDRIEVLHVGTRSMPMSHLTFVKRIA